MPDTIKNIKISTIKIGKQFRKEMGDLEELAESIRHGLLQPIGVTPKRQLIFGYRRLLAYRDVLKQKTIPARIVDVPSILDGMLTENLVRKDFTVSERVAIFQTVKAEFGNRRGQRTDLGLLGNCPEVAPGETTEDFAAKRSGLGNRRTAERAMTVVEAGVTELVEAMDSGEVSISAAAEVASLPAQDQREMLEAGCDQGKLVAKQVRQHKHQQEFQERQLVQQKVLAQGVRDRKWSITASQKIVSCNLLIADQPYGITDEPWEPKNLEKFTRGWASKWASCSADFIAVFFSQEHMWNGRKWLDESLQGYEFQQLLIWHAPNNIAPKSRVCFKQTWEPIFLYRRVGSERLVHDHGSQWTGELHDFDCHVAPVPERDFGGHDFKQHPCQKPVSAMKWLINALTKPGEKVVSLFSGVSPCGVAALQLGRQYHGIETNKDYRTIAEKRLAAFGTPDRPQTKVKVVRPNTVVQGDCLDLIPLLPDQSVNLVVTSPVYAEQRNGHYPGVSSRMYPEFTLHWMTALWDTITDTGSVLIVIRPDLKNGIIQDYVLRTRLLLRESGWKECETLIWHKRDGGACMGSSKRPRRAYEEILWFSKTNDPYIDAKACGHWSDRVSFRGSNRFGMGGGQDIAQQPGQTRVADVIDVPVGGIDAGIQHPAMFPTELAEILVKTFCPPKGSVLDNFCGSGSTLLGVERAGEGRIFYGFDIEPNYVAIARQRLAENNGHTDKRKVPSPKSSRNGNGRSGVTNNSQNGRHVARRAK